MANTSPTPDSLTVYLSGDAWNGNAEATVSINGVQVGGVLDVSAANASDGAQAFTFTGNFGAAPKVSLSFVNDASDGTPGHDRNLYLDGYSYDGNAQLGTKQALLWDQTVNTTLSSAPAATERASAFLNSMGVNVHLNYLDTSYGNTAATASDVAYLGVSRLRIGLADITLHLPQLQAFAAQGVKFDVLMPGTETDASLAADVAKLNAIAPSVAAVEGPNEPNLPGNFSWDGQSGNAAVAAYQKALFTDVKATPSLASAAIYAPTLGGVGADGYAALGNISAYATAGNMHVYYPGTAPNSTIQYNLGLSAIDTPGLPSVITETNYTNDPAIQGSVSSDVQAKYDLDIFMDAAKAGVQSTYIYELMDEFADPTNANIEDHYGLFNVDGTPKPAATAIHNLHAILADPGATASTFTPGTLAYTVTGQGASSNTLLMEKSSGAYDLTVWAEPQIWNAATKSEAAATPRQVTVALGQLASSVSVYDPMAGTAAIAQYSNTSQVTVSVTDHPLVIEINTAPPTAVSMASSAAPGSTLTTGQTAVLTVTASEAVTVAGTPTLLLSDGGTATYDAAHSSGATLAFDATVQAGQATPDLAVIGVSPNGATITDAAGKALVMPATLPGADMGVRVNPPPPGPLVLGHGPDTLALFVSEDALQGDAQFTVTVNGTQAGGVMTATAPHAAGATQEIDLLGYFNTGLYQAGITLANPLQGAGATGGSRTLHVDGAALNGMAVAGSSLTLTGSGAQHFDFGGNAGKPTALGSGPDTLALSVSEDAFQGDAQFTVAVDGVQIGGVQTVTALHGAKATQEFDVHGSFGSGAHQASVTFLNDASTPGAGDRNLYVDSATLDGTAVGGAALSLYSNGSQGFNFGSAPIGPTVLGQGPTTLALFMSEDAFQGNAQFTVAVDGVQVGGVQVATAARGLTPQEFDVHGSFAAGTHQASITFLNDAYAPGLGDRNLYLDSATVGGTAVGGASAALMYDRVQSFSFTVPTSH